MPQRFTGKHMFAILVAFFGVVVAVNVTMARFASSTFGGIVVENSYVASQEFNGWLDEAEAQKALGWSAAPEFIKDGKVELVLDGVPAGAKASAVARHPLGRLPDQELTFVSIGPDTYMSDESLEPGRWILRIELEAEGNVWRHEEEVRR